MQILPFYQLSGQIFMFPENYIIPVIWHMIREGAINTLRGGCANLASFDPKMLTPPKNGNIGLDPP